MTTKYFAILTQIGAEKLAQATAQGKKLNITDMAVGDGGGSLPVPEATQTKLVNELRRAPVNQLAADKVNKNQIFVDQVIPESVGGFWIREIGLYDADGSLVAVASCAETYKPLLQEGSGRTLTVRIVLIVSSVSNVELKVDPSVVLATKSYVDDAAEAVKNLIVVATQSASIDSALYDLSTPVYAVRNRRQLGTAYNKLRTDRALTIVCVGDSITYGYDAFSADKLPALEGHTTTRAPVQYPGRLYDRLNLLTKSAVTVINRGYSGDTAKQCFERWPENPGGDVVHIMLGINDAAGRFNATFEQYGEYMEKLIRQYIAWGHGVVIHTATAQTFNNANAGGARFTQYIRGLAESYGCPVFESEGVHQYCRYAEVYSDATHFNAAGYAKYGDAVASFILAGCWVRPVRGISAVAMQQPGRTTEGIGWHMTGGASLATSETGSYVWNGQTGTLTASQDGIHSFSFYLDGEAANVYAIARLNGATVHISDPLTTVSGLEAANKAVPKFYPRSIAETKSYKVAARPQGYKSWVGGLIGRGWKTIYFRQNVENADTVYLNEIIIEPCTPEETAQDNSGVTPAKKDVVVFSRPIASLANPMDALPAAEKMPNKVYIPLPKGLYRQSQAWGHWYDNMKLDISILTRKSSGGATYEGIHKLVAYTVTTALGASLAFESTYKTAANCLTPTSIQYGFSDPATPDIITENAYPGVIQVRMMYLILTFPDAPEAYYTMEVECSSLLNSAGSYLY